MLTSDFSNELSSLIRSLQQRVLMEPVLLRPMHTGGLDALDNIDQAIISLVALRVNLTRGQADAT